MNIDIVFLLPVQNIIHSIHGSEPWFLHLLYLGDHSCQYTEGCFVHFIPLNGRVIILGLWNFSNFLLLYTVLCE